MFERDLLFRELANLNREYETAVRDYFLDISLNNNPNAIIEEAAVKPFNQEDRAFLYTDLLPVKPTTKKVKGKTITLPSIEGQTKKNNSKIKNKKIFGVDVPIFLDRLQKYVDFQVIEQSLIQKYPQLVIDRQKSLNGLVTEAIHQFQAKIFMDKADWDGIVGPSVLSSLGFVFHQEKRFTSQMANTKIKNVFKKIDKYIKEYVAGSSIGLPDINGQNWFDFIINPAIFGRSGTKGFGFHLLLILKLRAVENDLCSLLASELTSLFDKEISPSHGFQSKTYGQVPRLLGKVLNIEEKHGDIRSESKNTPLSRHLSGMAIDINYTGNPWIRGSQGLKMINKALTSAKKNTLNITQLKTVQKFFADLAKNNNTADIFDKLKVYSNDCVNFLGLKSVNWGASNRSPNRGFLNLRKELVIALRDKAGLAWAAVDLGTGDLGNGDMMHFDMRTSSFGQAYSKEIGQDGINDYLKMVHPNFQRVDFKKKDNETLLVFERNLLNREISDLYQEFESKIDCHSSEWEAIKNKFPTRTWTLDNPNFRKKTYDIVQKAGQDPDKWFNNFARDFTFLGRKFNKPVHLEFATHLKIVEEKLAKKYGNHDPAKAGDALQLSKTEFLIGGRQESSTAKKGSMHTFGLAMDVNHDGNPYLGGTYETPSFDSEEKLQAFLAKLKKELGVQKLEFRSGQKIKNGKTVKYALHNKMSLVNIIFEHMGLLLNSKKEAYPPITKYNYNTRLALFDELERLSNTLVRYFNLTGTQLNQLLSQAEPGSFWYGKNAQTALAQIDLDWQWFCGFVGRWSERFAVKANGFLKLDRRFVDELELDWGATYGDIMHFDMRNKCIGDTINRIIFNKPIPTTSKSSSGSKPSSGAISNSSRQTLSSDAVRSNRIYGEKLGWSKYIYQINDFLLPFSGLSNVSLGEEAFADAVAKWQAKNGFTGSNIDGVIGPVTWNKLRDQLGIGNKSTVSPPLPGKTSSAGKDRLLANINQYNNLIEEAGKKYDLHPNIIRAIIAAESGGDRYKKSSANYKGLMQAERGDDQYNPKTSIETGTKKFATFKNSYLIPRLKNFGIDANQIDQKVLLSLIIASYNAGHITVLKALEYAHKSGDWKKWLDAENYQRALVFSRGYHTYESCHKNAPAEEIKAAKQKRIEYSKWREKGNRQNFPDPPQLRVLEQTAPKVMMCWVKTKYVNTSPYINKFLSFI